MALRGAVATGMETASKVPFVCRLALLEPEAARFLVFLSNVQKDTVQLRSTDYKVQERRPRGQSTTMGASALAGATTITLTDTSHLSVGDLIWVPARSYQGRINAVNSATSVDVTPDLGSTTTALTSGDAVLRVARVMNEGYTVLSSYVTDTTQTTNYVSTISTPVEWTNYQSKDQSYLSDNQKSSRMKADETAMAIEHMREIDRQLWFSVKSATTDSNSKRLLTTQGMLASISTNSYDHSGGSTITETQFNQYVVEPIWRNNGASTEKWLFAASKTLSIFEGFGIGRLQFQEVKSRELGFSISGYRTTRGLLNVVHNPHFDVSYYDESCCIVDPKFVKLAILQDTEYLKDMQPKNVKTIQNEWSTMMGLYMVYEEAHGKGRDFRTAA